MGENLISFYKSKVKHSWKIAFFTTFFACLLIHIYKFTNTLPNHDSFFNVYTDQDMTISGRWFLQFACGISSYFDLPWVNGLLCAVYLGITAAAVTELFDLKNPVEIGLSGLILAACPSTTETLFFEFTADGYLMGLMLCAIAACFSCKASKWRHYAVSGLCLCLSCAIYQAYISFAVVLSICYLVNRILNQQVTVKAAWKWIGRHVLLYIAALAVYYVLWKVILTVTGQEATNYQGINNVGQIGVSTLISGAVKSVKNLVMLFLEWNILEHPVTLYAILNILYLFSLVFILVAAVIRSKTYQKPSALILILLALIASVPIMSIWCFLSEGVQYRPMMLHSAAVFYIFALILFDRWVGVKCSTVFGIFIAGMIFNFAIMANISYFYLDKCYEKSYYEGIWMMEAIEEAQQESPEEIESIAFIGNRLEAVSISETSPGNKIHLLSQLIEENTLYDHEHTYPYLQSMFDLDLPQASASQLNELQTSIQVQEMEVWPDVNSIQVVDNVLVIKLEDNP